MTFSRPQDLVPLAVKWISHFLEDLGTKMAARRAGDAALCRRGQAASGAGRTPSWPSSPATSMMMRLSTKMPSRKQLGSYQGRR